MTSEPSIFSAFGVFAPMFDDGHYLPLLNLHRPDDAVSALRKIVSTRAPGLEANILALLDPIAGWRPQLVGAAAMVAGAASRKTVDALWVALAEPSFVSPQLAVAAYLLDPDFEAHARSRIANGCRVEPKRLREKFPDQEWPASPDAKQLAAMIALCGRLPRAAWLAEMSASAELRSILDEARDDGSGIALAWLEKASQALQSRS